MRQCLLNTGLFSEVNFPFYSEEERQIKLEVRDKYSRVFLPTYQQSRATQDTFWGALFYDANVVGRGHSTGFLYSHQQEKKRDSYSFFYDVPYIDSQGKHGFTLIGYSRDTDFYSYQKTRWTHHTREIFRFLWLRGAYHINQDVSLLYGYAPTVLAYSSSFAREDPDTQILPDFEYTVQSFNFGMVWDATDKEFYYERGLRLQHTYYHQLSRTDNQDVSAAYLFDFYWGLPFFSRNILTMRIAAGARDRVDEVDNLRIGSEPGSRGIPDHGAWNQQYITLGLDYEFLLTKGRYGYWTIGPFIDQGYQWNVFHHPKQNFGYYATGLVTYVYLQQVNVPALGFFFSSNSEYQKDFVSFYIGFRV